MAALRRCGSLQVPQLVFPLLPHTLVTVSLLASMLRVDALDITDSVLFVSVCEISNNKSESDAHQLVWMMFSPSRMLQMTQTSFGSLLCCGRLALLK
jgi:hypothetical protein